VGVCLFLNLGNNNYLEGQTMLKRYLQQTLNYYIELYGSWQRALEALVLAGLTVAMMYGLLVAYIILGRIILEGMQ